jgi:hypothetical protein
MTTEEVRSFFADRLPEGWFEGPPSVEVDDDEILCVGTLPSDGPAVESFREQTRADRMAIAGDAETRFQRKVSWGVEREGVRTVFTSQSVPVMTRLRIGERAVLDTLIDAGVARSRSDALAWCVKLVGRHQSDWLAELREALVSVEQVRATGPTPL